MDTNIYPQDPHKIRQLQLDELDQVTRAVVDTAVKRVLNSNKKLDLQIRSNYFNIYYKGGSLLKVTGIFPGSTSVRCEFNKKYFIREDKVLPSKWLPGTDAPIASWFKKFEEMQDTMKGWLKANPSKEMDLRHKLSVNHRSNLDSEWIFLDAEYAAIFYRESGYEERRRPWRRGQFDLIGVKREDLEKTTPLPIYICELKQGQQSIKGDSGIVPHAIDMQKLICQPAHSQTKLALVDSVRISSIEKAELGLLPETAAVIFERPLDLRPAFILKGVKPKDIRVEHEEVEKLLLKCCDSVLWLNYIKVITSKVGG
jgi:hypothetical protein